MKHRFLFSSAVFVCLFLIGALATQPAQADSYYWRFTPPLPPVSCGQDGNVFIEALGVNYEYNLPAGASLDVYLTIDGVTNFDHSEAAPSGTGTGSIADLFYAAGLNYPTTLVVRYDTVIGKTVVYSSSITFSCQTDGAGDVSVPGGGSGTCPTLPDGSVVGALPESTQAFYAPGKVSPGLFINPGTYWVIGEDSSGQYYEIMLSCQFLWVPINSMQPSYQSPWTGQSLPTRVVG